MISDPAIDRRIVRTRQAIREAFISLIEEKGFDALSVKDIAAKANINRGTFYLHYQDKFDLLEQTEAELISSIREIVRQMPPLDTDDLKSIEMPLPVIVSIFEYLKDNASTMRAILGLKGDVAFQSQVKKAIENNLFRIGMFAHVNQKDLVIPLDYLISYITSADLGVVEAWLKRGCLETPQEMAMIISKFTFFGPISALRST